MCWAAKEAFEECGVDCGKKNAGKKTPLESSNREGAEETEVCDVSYTTVQRTVHRRGLHAFKQQKTSRLSQAHKRGRLQFAKTNIKRDWSHVVFSDEHTFKQFKGGNPRHNFVWAKSVGEVPSKEVERWGLAVNTWAGFSSRGKTKLAFYEGTLDAPAYQNILQKKLLPAAQVWYEDEKERWELQQDRATCHMAKSTKRWLEQHEVEVEGWHTKALMANLWAIVDEKLESKKFRTKKAIGKSNP